MKYQVIPVRDEFTKKISWALKFNNQVFHIFDSKFEATAALIKLTDIDKQFNF